MYSVFKSNLGRRVFLLVIIGTVLVLSGLTVSGWLAVHQSTERVLQERDALAKSTATYLDYVVTQTLARLDSVAFSAGLGTTTADAQSAERELHTIHIGSVLDGVFITDASGIVLWSEPSGSVIGTSLAGIVAVNQSLLKKRPEVSDVVKMGPSQVPVVLILTPSRNADGGVTGLVGGWIEPAELGLRQIVQSSQVGPSSYADVVDSGGTVIASTIDARVLTQTAPQGGAAGEVIRSAPLTTARWSVVVGQTASEAFAPARTMAIEFAAIGLGSLVLALFLAWGMARSMITPLGQLSASVQRISGGDLSHPLPRLGNDEIGQLGQSFESMRLELKKSLEEIQRWNRDLEDKVTERSRQLQESFREIERKDADRSRLLRQVLTAQEEERKRIARELHDETTQALVGLVMRLETFMAVTTVTDADRARLAELKGLATRTIDNVHKIIFDLRPSVLDDLGLVSAIRWYAENRLAPEGVQVRVEVSGEERKLPPPAETALFRVVQEAVTNVARHAAASNMVLSLEFGPSSVRIEIEDDGKGFDPGGISPHAGDPQGVGLLGMRERIALIGGKFTVWSQPGSGTHITIEVGQV